VTTHHDRVRAEFTKQADLFAAAPQMTDREAVERLLELARPAADEEALDVACGPGIVACALAARARRVTGIDLTPAMLEKARALGAGKGFENLEWVEGDVAALPFEDSRFPLVVSRYSLHHFLDPRRVLCEMRRVCRPPGCIVIADVTVPEEPERAAAYNAMERLRDPSHVRALARSEILGLFDGLGLAVSGTARYRVEFDLEVLLQGSFPVEGGAEKIRRIFQESLSDDALGVGACVKDGRIHFSYPITIYRAEV
jgi:ubiquinone/menaquinone biosynthesis C-methylase UbiE